MEKLDYIKDQCAFNRGYHGYIEMFTGNEETISYIDEVAEKYAKEKVNEALDKAAEKIKEDMYSRHTLYHNCCKNSIKEILKLKI